MHFELITRSGGFLFALEKQCHAPVLRCDGKRRVGCIHVLVIVPWYVRCVVTELSRSRGSTGTWNSVEAITSINARCAEQKYTVTLPIVQVTVFIQTAVQHEYTCI